MSRGEAPGSGPAPVSGASASTFATADAGPDTSRVADSNEVAITPTGVRSPSISIRGRGPPGQGGSAGSPARDAGDRGSTVTGSPSPAAGSRSTASGSTPKIAARRSARRLRSASSSASSIFGRARHSPGIFAITPAPLARSPATRSAVTGRRAQTIVLPSWTSSVLRYHRASSMPALHRGAWRHLPSGAGVGPFGPRGQGGPGWTLLDAGRDVAVVASGGTVPSGSRAAASSRRRGDPGLRRHRARRPRRLGRRRARGERHAPDRGRHERDPVRSVRGRGPRDARPALPARAAGALGWASIAGPSSRAPSPGRPRAPWPALLPIGRRDRPQAARDFDVAGQPAGRQGGPHHVLAQLHGQLRPARLRPRRRRGQDPAGRRLPGRRVQPARLHEGPLLPQPGLRRGPDHEAADPHRRARLRRVPRGDLGRGPGQGRGRPARRSARQWGWDSIHVFGQVPGSGYVQKGANYRACALLGMTHGTSFDFNGDLPMGMPITFGVQNAEHEAKDWANSRFLLLVGLQPGRDPDPGRPLHLRRRRARRPAGRRSTRASRPPPPRPTPTCASGPGRTPRWRWRCAARSSRTAPGTPSSWPRTRTRRCSCARTPGKRLREADLVAGGAERQRFVAWDTATRPAGRSWARTGWASRTASGRRSRARGQVTLADGDHGRPRRPGFALVRDGAGRAGRPEAAAEVTGMDPPT